MGTLVLEIDDERIPKERPPRILPVPPGTAGNVIIEHLPPVSRFEIFGKSRIMVPRSVTVMSKVLESVFKDLVLSSGQREEREIFPIASDHPEEVYRYFNYARLVHGKVLVIGLGLGLFPRLAIHAKEFVIVSIDQAIFDLMKEPILQSIPIEQELTISNSLPYRIGHSLEPYRRVQFDWAFIDLNPYVGPGELATKYLTLSQVNECMKAVMDSKVMKSGGKILVKGYSQMIKDWQLKCQKLSYEIPGILEPFLETVTGIRHPMDQKFINWAMKNRRRVVEKRDYKFINAWARSSVHEF